MTRITLFHDTKIPLKLTRLCMYGGEKESGGEGVRKSRREWEGSREKGKEENSIDFACVTEWKVTVTLVS